MFCLPQGPAPARRSEHKNRPGKDRRQRARSAAVPQPSRFHRSKFISSASSAVMLPCLLVLAPLSVAVPTVRLNNGVHMPVMAAGTAGLSGTAAANAVLDAVALNLTHFHTAFDYYNLKDLAAAFNTLPRKRLFISSMTSPCVHPAAPPARNVTDPAECYNLTISEVASVLTQLNVDQLDLLMLHGPSEPFGHVGSCSAQACMLNRAQWRAYEWMLRAKRVRAIGVSNFCQSCLECLSESSTVPAVNQIQLHVGMGADPGGLLSFAAERGIVVQAYEPLAGGEVVSDPLCKQVGTAYNRTAAQVGLRWVLERAPALAVKAGSPEHLRQDLDAWSWSLSEADRARLDAATQPKGEADGRTSWGCTQ